jgi:DNA modification methylase
MPAAAIAPTTHSFVAGDARCLSPCADASVDLAVTSPPYPMIAMWDEVFRAADAAVVSALEGGDGPAAFRLMHAQLDRAWDELLRVTRPGGFICVNLGDATRTLGGAFRLYPNHTRVEQFFYERGADVLPRIVWRKTTNAPNKFLGSGMLPAGAYVTLEHEYILIVRRPGKRDFTSPEERRRRRQSALFWEERNQWYSDLWELGGARQALAGPDHRPRARSGAFPIEIALRLIAMHSLQGDLVLDPFAGLGTTAQAAVALARNSLCVDREGGLMAGAAAGLPALLPGLARLGQSRIERHRAFAVEHRGAGKTMRHASARYGCAVKTSQETDLIVPVVKSITALADGRLRAEYEAGE